MAAGDELSGAAGHRRIVRPELHRERRLVHPDPGQRRRIHRIEQRVADLDVGQSRDHADVAGRDFPDLDLLDPRKELDLAGAPPLDDLAARPDRRELAGPLEDSGEDPPDRLAAHVVGVFRVCHDHLERTVSDGGRRDVLENGVQERAEVAGARRRIEAREPETARAVQDGEVEVMVERREREKEVADLLLHFEGPRVRAVDLVDENDRPLVPFDRLFQHETGLRQRPFGRVDQEEHAFHHRQDALDLGAEVPVPGRVDDVDDRVAIADGRVLREDRDPPLALEVSGVHDQLGNLLAGAKGAALFQQCVDERRLAVVNVGHDGKSPPVRADADRKSGGGGSRHDVGHILRRMREPTKRSRPENSSRGQRRLW